jgi:non-ribosomal peptide synthetase component F
MNDVLFWRDVVRAKRIFERDVLPSRAPSTSGTPIEAPIVAIECESMFFAALAEMVCFLAGACFFPLNPRDPPRRREQLLRQCPPHTLLNEGDIAHLLNAARSTDVVEQEMYSCGCAEIPDHFVAYLISTSGTTGSPKIVVAERKNILSYVRELCALSIGEGGRHVPAESSALPRALITPALWGTLLSLQTTAGRR